MWSYQMTVSDHLLLALSFLQKVIKMVWLWHSSSLLALVSSAREGDMDRHLQAERYMIKQLFSFDHQN